MATIKAVLHKQYKSKDGRYPLVIRVAHLNKRRLFFTGYKIREENWDGEKVKTLPERFSINAALQALLTQARAYDARCTLEGKPFSMEGVFRKVAQDGGFTQLMEEEMEWYRKKDKISTVHRLKALLDHLREWKGGEVQFSHWDEQGMRSFELFLSTVKGNSTNTICSKWEMLQLYYTRGMKKWNIPGPNPFVNYHIKRTPVQKVRLSEEEFQKLLQAPLNKKQTLFRDMFLFSYYCRGVRFENVLTMKKANILGDRIYYVAVKGGKPGSVKITTALQEIVQRYKNEEGPFLFPIMTPKAMSKEEFIRFKNGKNVLVNKGLKRIAHSLGIREFTLHSARHTLAYNLKKSTGSIHVIKDVLLHHDSKMTERYLQSLDDEFLDDALNSVYDK